MTRVLEGGWERCPECGERAPPRRAPALAWVHDCDPGAADRARALVERAVLTGAEEDARAARSALAALMERVGVLEELLRRTGLERADLLALSALLPRSCFCGEPGVTLGRRGPLCARHSMRVVEDGHGR